MTLEESLYAHLSGLTELTDIVGTKIYPLLIQQEDLVPAVTFRRVSTVRNFSHQGSAHATKARIQVDAISTTLSLSKSIVDLIRDDLDGFSGVLGGGVTVAPIMAGNEQNFYDEQTNYKRVTIDLLVSFYGE